MFIKIIIVFFTFFLFVNTKSASAQDLYFDISVDTKLNTSIDGKTNAVQEIIIKNKTEFKFTQSYTINTGYQNINNVEVFSSDGPIPYKIINNNDTKSINLSFSKRIVGKGKENKFIISYDTPDVSKKIGNIWRVNIPGISTPDDFFDYKVTLSIPDKFGKLSIAKPYKFLGRNESSFLFDKDDIGRSGILLFFGENQYYKLDLTYHLSNPNFFKSRSEIAIPPSTNYQDVIINSISPKPDTVYEDSEGNWLAVFDLLPQKKLTIRVGGVVRVNPAPTTDDIQYDDNKYLKDDKYWEISSPEISSIAEKLNTPLEIYNYVINKLSYDYGRSPNNNLRLGALASLKKPKSSVCLEFTDLFIAISRKKGIPARSVEGYAFTDNTSLRPLSLEKDVLHAWPEYYDRQTNTWTMIDPTWGNTTKGMDYYNTLDFDHIAFVIKGNSTNPIPAGGYKLNSGAKNVNVVFANPKNFIQRNELSLNLNISPYFIPFINSSIDIIVENKGNTSVTGKYVNVKSDLLEKENKFFVDFIPPFGKKIIKVNLDNNIFLTNNKSKVTISLEEKKITKELNLSFFSFPAYILGGIFLVSTAIIFITIKTWRLYFQK